MRIFKKILRKLYHFIAFLSVFLLFLPRVNAIVNINGTDFVQSSQVNFYDNTNGNLTSVGATYRSSPYEQWVSSSNLTTTGGNTAGANIAFTINSSFVSGYTYALSVLIGMENGTLKASSSRICIAENLTNSATRYSNTSGFPCTNALAKVTQDGYASYTATNGNNFQYGVLTMIFTADFTSPSITFAYQSVGSNYSSHTFGGYHLDVLAQPINGLTQQQVQSIINNSGLATANSVSQVQSSINQIQQDINSSANNIINNNNNNTNNIINNQNENTQQEIESQKSCRNVKYTLTLDTTNNSNDYYMNDSGTLVPVATGTGYDVSDYYHISSKSSIFAQSSNSLNAAAICFYDKDKTLLSCERWNRRLSIEITPPTNTDYFRTTIATGSVTVTGSYCGNGNQVITDSIDDLNDTLNDNSVDSSDDTLNNLKNQIPTNSVISDLLLLPIRFLQNFVNALNSSCSSFSLGSLLGTNLVMPCINLENYLGSTIWTMIDLIFSGMFVYSLRKKFIEIYQNITNLKNGGNEVD